MIRRLLRWLSRGMCEIGLHADPEPTWFYVFRCPASGAEWFD